MRDENLKLEMTSDQWERILYARLSMEDNQNSNMPALFDYLATTWTRLFSKKQNLMKLENENVQLKELVAKRLQKLDLFMGLVMNYTNLTINPDLMDMFPTNHTHGAGYLGYQLATINDIDTVYSRAFMQAFIDRFKDEGLEQVCWLLILGFRFNN